MPSAASIVAAPGPPPSWVDGEYPHWLEEELRRSFGEKLAEEMRALQQSRAGGYPGQPAQGAPGRGSGAIDSGWV